MYQDIIGLHNQARLTTLSFFCQMIGHNCGGNNYNYNMYTCTNAHGLNFSIRNISTCQKIILLNTLIIMQGVQCLVDKKVWYIFDKRKHLKTIF